MMRKTGAIAIALTLPLGACDDMGVDGGEREHVSLSFAAIVEGGLAASVLATPPIGDDADTLDLTALSLTFDEVVLERSEDENEGDSDGETEGDSDSDSEDDSDSDGTSNERFEGGAVTVDIPLDGDVVTELTVPVPSGRYEELELDIGAVRFVGTFNGEAIDVTVPLDLELETEFDPAIDVADAVNLTVTLELGALLREADGQVIDPRLLLTDDAMRGRLVQRIAVSLHAFEDSDHDADESDSDSDSEDDDDEDDDNGDDN